MAETGAPRVKPNPQHDERFLFRARPADDGCWIWEGIHSKRGYASIYCGKDRYLLAHRWSYRRYNGAIPDGMQVHHLCGRRNCVNPDHLVLVMHEDHLRIHRYMMSKAEPPQNDGLYKKVVRLYKKMLQWMRGLAWKK